MIRRVKGFVKMTNTYKILVRKLERKETWENGTQIKRQYQNIF